MKIVLHVSSIFFRLSFLPSFFHLSLSHFPLLFFYLFTILFFITFFLSSLSLIQSFFLLRSFYLLPLSYLLTTISNGGNHWRYGECFVTKGHGSLHYKLILIDLQKKKIKKNRFLQTFVTYPLRLCLYLFLFWKKVNLSVLLFVVYNVI